MASSTSGSSDDTSDALSIKLLYTHHDHDYVERRGGPALYTHMRAAPSRGRYRRAALERAYDMYSSALRNEGTTMRVGGLGLVLLQRAILAAEDFGVLLHALLGKPPSFERLTSATYPELDRVFLGVHDSPDDVVVPFILPTREVLEGDGFASREVEAAMRLAALTRSRWLRMLERVGALWLEQRVVAKATMHGIPLVAGELVLGPPPAGVLAEDLRDPRVRPFAVAVLSRVERQERQVITDRHVVALDDRSVGRYLRAGKAAVRLSEELSETQATSIELGYGYGVPFHALGLLSTEQRELLARAGERQAEEH